MSAIAVPFTVTPYRALLDLSELTWACKAVKLKPAVSLWSSTPAAPGCLPKASRASMYVVAFLQAEKHISRQHLQCSQALRLDLAGLKRASIVRRPACGSSFRRVSACELSDHAKHKTSVWLTPHLQPSRLSAQIYGMDLSTTYCLVRKRKRQDQCRDRAR